MVKRKREIKKPKLKYKFFKNYAPGTVTYVGKKQPVHTSLDIIDYSKIRFDRFNTDNIEEAFNYKETGSITWINVNGLNNTESIVKIGEHYKLHPLIQEDIVSTNQRPKIDEYDDYLYIVFKMLYYSEQGDFINEHVSMIVGKDYVITFQESDEDVFDSVRDRLENSKGRIRNAGTDYLMFSILDAVVDNYFNVIETLSSKIEIIEDQLFEDSVESGITQDIQEIKKEILRIRKAVVPLREVINRMEKTDTTLIEDRTRNYIRDLYDHIVQVNESVDIYREMIWGLMDMYMSTISNKMNEVMKVLTIMATIFIPLTFMAGIYGMNFDNMPELHAKYGYFYLLGAMVIVFFALLWYFRRKKWI